MLDPGSALSLACNIIQIVDFSLKAVSKLRELYHDGASSENLEVEDMAVRLKSLRGKLVTVGPTTGQSRHVYFDDKELQALADECCKTADELTAELDTLKVSGPHKRRQAVRKLFRSIRRKSVVKEIQVKLDGYQKVLDTRILVSLRKRIDLNALLEANRFNDLDTKVQALIKGLQNQQSSFEQLSKLIREEHESAKKHVTEQFSQYRKDSEKAEYRRRYLESLAFPGMRARQELIIKSYDKTSQWIFDESGESRIYWIQGKAGSGKSTLMSYISQDQRTKASLRSWAGAHKLLIVPFFFWKAGNDSKMQKNSAGLLRSLLYQILENLPDLTPSLAQNHNDLQDFQTSIDGSPPIPAWTESRLLNISRKLLFDLSSTHRLCLFIDGLDEIDGDQNDLVDLLLNMARGPNIKICLSSRPDRSFIDAFSSPAMLKLEDLTKKDIKLYVSRKLEGAWRKSPAVDDKDWISRMIDTILKKARGVFQWVRMVVGYLIQGFQSKDSLKELWKRLDELPEEIEKLYAYMLEKIDKVHRMEVASNLQIILQVYRTPSISELALAHYERRNVLFSPQATLPLIEIASQCTLVRQRVKLICGGLLEFRETNDISSESEGRENTFVIEGTSLNQGESSSPTLQPNAFERAKTTFHQNRTTRVHLIHRTAYDFLKDNKVGKDFVESNIPATFDVYGSYIEARLAQLVVLAQNEDFYSTKSAGPLFSETEISDIFPPDTPESTASLSSRSGIASLDPPATTASLSSRSSVASLPGAYRRKDKSGFAVEIDVMMTLASQAEVKTNKAHRALIEKIDKVVTVLDQQYLRGPSKTHWCTRWGLSENPLPEKSFQDPIVPLDFLYFAAYHELHLYVLDTIQTRPQRGDPNTVTTLLRLSTRNDPIDLPSLELVTVLLRRGANPNVLSYTERYSVWTHFLTRMRVCADMNYLITTEEQWISAARTFIESGADVNAKIAAPHTNPFAWIISGNVGTELKIFEDYEVRAEMSVLAFLQDAKAPFSGFDEIEKMCIARGALWTSRTHSSYLQGRFCALSPRQFEEVDKLVFAWSCKKAGRPVSLSLESLREILLRLYHELELDRPVRVEEDTSDEDAD